MLNRILDGIETALKEEFAEIPIYREEAEEGLLGPSFLLLPKSVSQMQSGGSRYFRQYCFTVQYLPDDGQERHRKANTIAEQLFLSLEHIAIGNDLIRGINMRYEKEEGKLNFYVDYHLYVRKDTVKDEVMDDMTINSQIKE